jgi:hypothetical protein
MFFLCFILTWIAPNKCSVVLFVLYQDEQYLYFFTSNSRSARCAGRMPYQLILRILGSVSLVSYDGPFGSTGPGSDEVGPPLNMNVKPSPSAKSQPVFQT